MTTMINRDKVRARILELANENDGRITAEMVVDDSKRPDSPLHEVIEQDAEKGLAQWQLMQARQLIRSVRIEVSTITHTIRPIYFVRDPDLPRDQQGYIATPQLLSDEDKARRAVLKELERVTQSLRRAREIAIELNLEAQVDEFLGLVGQFEEQVQQAA